MVDSILIIKFNEPEVIFLMERRDHINEEKQNLGSRNSVKLEKYTL